jgi:hypothetical protein
LCLLAIASARTCSGLLRRVGHVVDLLLHLLFGDLLGCFAVALGRYFDDLVDDGVRLPVESEGVGSVGCLLNVRLVVPFSNVAGKDVGSGDYDHRNVDQLPGYLCSIGGFCHTGVSVDGIE